MSTKVQVGHYSETGEWMPFETVQVDVEGLNQSKLAGEAKTHNSPLWSGVTHVRITADDGTKVEADISSGRFVWGDGVPSAPLGEITK